VELVRYRRQLDQDLARAHQELQPLIEAATLSEGQDRVSWSLEGDGVFSVKSMYARLSPRGNYSALQGHMGN
jgi:hypothetical protein